MRLPSPLSRARITPARLLALSALMLVLVAAPARAAAGHGSLVYVAGGEVHVANADGSDARAISPKGNWAWPSESDAGAIAVLSTDGYRIYGFNQQGQSLLSSPILTPASIAHAGYYVNHIRISPDGSRVAYNIVNCCGESGESTFLQPTTAGNSAWSDFADDYINPVWVDASAANDPYVASQDGLGLGSNGYNWAAAMAGTCCQYGIWNADKASDNSGWKSDLAIPSDEWEFEVAYTRDLKHLALLLDDSPIYTGVAHNVEIVLESIDWADSGDTTNDCTIPLSAASYSQIPQTIDSISYSSDGSLLAWATDAGIYEANVSDPSDCDAVVSSIHLVVPGGSYPYFGAPALSPPAKPKTIPAPNTKITRASVNHHTRTATFRFSGSGGSGTLTFRCRLDHGPWAKCAGSHTYKHLKRGKHTFSVEAVDRRGKVDPTPAISRFKV